MPEMRTWQAMREQIQDQLRRRTGEGVEEWNRRIAGRAPADEPALRAWLESQGVTGYPENLLVWETFGYHNYGDPWKEQRYAGD